jgi:cell volume regulation protein A
MADTLLVFAAVSAIIVFGFLGEQVFRKTGVPSFLFLILMGILLGPVFQIFSGQQLMPILGLFAELTLIMILFYSGLEMKLRSLIRGASRAVLLVFLYVPIAIAATGLFAHLILRWDLLQSFIFGSIIGGQTAAPVVVPLARSLKLTEEAVTIITIESVLNSIVGIVVFLALLQVYVSGAVSWVNSTSEIVESFSIGVVPAALLSVAWILLLERVKDQRYTYVLTLGLLLGTYVLVSVLGGSGELGVFVFGLLLGNYSILNRIAGLRISMEELMRRLSTFQGEISFLLNTLFFVFLGLTFQIDPQQAVGELAVATGFVAILMGSRVASVTVSTIRSGLSKQRPEIVLMSAQGVTQATLAIIALNAGLPLGNTFLALVAYVIILTNVITTIGSVWIRRTKAYPFKEFMQYLQELPSASA